MRKIDEIIIHCTATKEGVNVTPSQIKQWHLERGFSDIGYHYVITIDGRIHPCRPDNKPGAHTKGHNKYSIGICYVGGLDPNGNPKDTRTDAQRDSLLRLLRQLKGIYRDATIHGHREFANKACPCFDVANEFSTLKPVI